MRRLSQRGKKIHQSRETLQTTRGVINYELTRSSARRSLSVCVTETAQVRVLAPLYLPDKEITGFIREKSDWIIKRLTEAGRTQPFRDLRRFRDGEEFLFLGKNYPLVFKNDPSLEQPGIGFTGGSWEVVLPAGLSEDEHNIFVHRSLVEWYEQQALELFGSRVFYFSRLMQVQPRDIVIKNPKRAWGICHHAEQKITLNWQIILAPREVVDYVIVHELAHLFVPNHSSRFWTKVEQYMPDYRHWKSWLRKNHAQMLLPEVS